MTRGVFLESCSRGECTGKRVHVTYPATPTKAKAAVNIPQLPPSKASAPRPPRIPNLNLELPDVQKASRPSHNKMRPVISSKTDKCVPCMQRPIPMFYFNPNIFPESAPGGDDGLAELYKPHSMKSPHAQHATKSIPSSQEHTIKLFGKSITTTITCSEEEEATIKHHSGKEPVPSHGIRIDKVVRIKDAVMDSHWTSIRKNRWIHNEARIEKRNTDVVRKIMMSGSVEEEVDEEKVPSAAAVAMVGRALNGAHRARLRR